MEIKDRTEFINIFNFGLAFHDTNNIEYNSKMYKVVNIQY